MNYKNIPIVMLVLALASPLLAMQVDVPNEIPAYDNLEITLTPSASEGTVKEARFYFYEEGKRDPLYAVFSNENGKWVTTVPYTNLSSEELSYYVMLQNTSGTFFRDPQIGTHKARLLHDTTPPALKLLSPQAFELALDKEQLVVFEVLDESSLNNYNLTLNGEPLTKSGVFSQYLSFLITPTEVKDAVIAVSMTDRYGNESKEEYTFKITGVKAPVFAANADYKANMEVEYVMAMGETQKTTNINDVLKDVTNTVNISYDLGGETYLKAGPISLEMYLELKDKVAATDILSAYPNTLIADMQNFLNLYNPINFTSEFDYTGEQARKFENDNQAYVKLSLFGPALTYTFGDQKVTYQKETIKDMSMRGSSLAIDLPFMELNVSKGLTDLGLYQVAWPEDFLGFKFAVKANKAWYLQTNLSFISSVQGTYAKMKVSGATSQIGTLYDLGSVKPDQNMVFGLSTGTDNKLFTLDASLSLSLYNDDAGTVIDVNQLANDLKSTYDLTSYVGYLDTINGIFPILNYFLPSNGLVAKAISQDLWGITYGVDLAFPKYGIDGWIRKTDATYKSLGSSVSTDEFTFGGTFEKSIADFSLTAGYSYDQDNIPDILFNDLIGLVKPSLKPTVTISESSIANIVHTATAGVTTPSSKILGSLGLDYSFEFATTNSDSLVSQTSDNTVKTAIQNSTNNDATLTHTGEVRWRSGRYKVGEDVTLNFSAKTKDSYVDKIKIDGATSSTTFWELSYAVSGAIKIGRYSISLGFDQDWSTEAASTTAFGYDAKFSVSNTFFDTISLSGSLDQAFKTSLDAYKITGSFALEKRFSFINTSATIDVSYYDSITTNSDDTLTASLTIKGTISK